MDDQLKLIKQLCERENMDLKESPPKYFASKIDGYKNKGIFADSVKLNSSTVVICFTSVSRFSLVFLFGYIFMQELPLTSLF
jgi:DNA helicase-2/ATP-dependent DNA helicase PcrA